MENAQYGAVPLGTVVPSRALEFVRTVYPLTRAPVSPPPVALSASSTRHSTDSLCVAQLRFLGEVEPSVPVSGPVHFTECSVLTVRLCHSTWHTRPRDTPLCMPCVFYLRTPSSRRPGRLRLGCGDGAAVTRARTGKRRTFSTTDHTPGLHTFKTMETTSVVLPTRSQMKQETQGRRDAGQCMNT